MYIFFLLALNFNNIKSSKFVYSFFCVFTHVLCTLHMHKQTLSLINAWFLISKLHKLTKFVEWRCWKSWMYLYKHKHGPRCTSVQKCVPTFTCLNLYNVQHTDIRKIRGFYITLRHFLQPCRGLDKSIPSSPILDTIQAKTKYRFR